jgi:hypothetical protein
MRNGAREEKELSRLYDRECRVALLALHRANQTWFDIESLRISFINPSEATLYSKNKALFHDLTNPSPIKHINGNIDLKFLHTTTLQAGSIKCAIFVLWIKYLNVFHTSPDRNNRYPSKKTIKTQSNTREKNRNYKYRILNTMGKGNTRTKHHCVGHKVWIGDISPGGCRENKVGTLTYCDKHEIACINSCKDWYHLKNQLGCMASKGRMMAEARRSRAVTEKVRGAVKMQEFQAFWNPGRERRKTRE